MYLGTPGLEIRDEHSKLKIQPCRQMVIFSGVGQRKPFSTTQNVMAKDTNTEKVSVYFQVSVTWVYYILTLSKNVVLIFFFNGLAINGKIVQRVPLPWLGKCPANSQDPECIRSGERNRAYQPGKIFVDKDS